MSGCTNHTQQGRGMGYGSTNWLGVQISLHRLAYCKANGLTPTDIQGRVIRHTCDNPRCINPKHLVVGTQQDNIDDKVRRGRHLTQIGVAHPRAKLTEADVQFIRKHYKPRCKTHGGSVLAKRFKVSPSIISGVVKRLGWQHL